MEGCWSLRYLRLGEKDPGISHQEEYQEATWRAVSVFVTGRKDSGVFHREEYREAA